METNDLEEGTYSTSNLWIDFGIVTFLSSSSNGSDLKNAGGNLCAAPEAANLGDGEFGRSVRGSPDGSWNQSSSPAYILKVNLMPSSGSRTSKLETVQTSKSWYQNPVRVGACPHPNRFRTAAAHITAVAIATLPSLAWRELSHP
jgi:hypothetical protein